MSGKVESSKPKRVEEEEEEDQETLSEKVALHLQETEKLDQIQKDSELAAKLQKEEDTKLYKDAIQRKQNDFIPDVLDGMLEQTFKKERREQMGLKQVYSDPLIDEMLGAHFPSSPVNEEDSPSSSSNPSTPKIIPEEEEEEVDFIEEDTE